MFSYKIFKNKRKIIELRDKVTVSLFPCNVVRLIVPIQFIYRLYNLTRKCADSLIYYEEPFLYEHEYEER